MTLTVTKHRAAELLDRAQALRVAVIGDAMLDVYLVGEVERISPEAPVPVVRVVERRHAMGGAANVAQNVVALGARCDLVAAIGTDRHGAILRGMLDGIAVGCAALVEVHRCTTTKTRVIARSQQLVRVDEEESGDLDETDVPRMLDAVRGALAIADAVVLEDYNKGVLVPAVIREAIALARRKDIPVVVDPKYANFFAFSGATVFKPNRRELQAALGAAVDIEHVEAVPAAFQRLGVEHILLTLGERGMALFSPGQPAVHVDTTARAVYDVVGAGDTVSAYLASMLAAGSTIREAAEIANIAAGIEVGKLGAATVSSAEVLDFFGAHRASEDRQP